MRYLALGEVVELHRRLLWSAGFVSTSSRSREQ